MGQQQLILLALAVVIVGGAIVVGIRAFNENSVKANSDGMMQDAVRIANDLQAWKQKPAPFGGQASVNAAAVADTANFAGAAFPLLGYQVNAQGEYNNLNGSYLITVPSPVTGDGALIEGVNLQFNNEVQITVNGLTDRTMLGSLDCINGVDAGGASCVPALDGQ